MTGDTAILFKCFPAAYLLFTYSVSIAFHVASKRIIRSNQRFLKCADRGGNAVKSYFVGTERFAKVRFIAGDRVDYRNGKFMRGPISFEFVIGPPACSSKVDARPSQN